tara:strand:+ start:3668 stop:4285 length:618 start_codon:yes stop_codon:yes gene_type:complete
MTKISLYSTVTPALGDKIIGTEVAGSPSNVTKNFTVGSIVDLLQLATLDRSLDATNVADSSITPTTTNTLEKISFGVAQANPNISLDIAGTITVQKAGWYLVETAFGVQAGIGSGKVITNIVIYKNGALYGKPQGWQRVQDSTHNIIECVTDSYQIELALNDTLEYYVLRDDDGANAGGLSYIRANSSSPLPDVPVARITLHKFN